MTKFLQFTFIALALPWVGLQAQGNSAPIEDDGNQQPILIDQTESEQDYRFFSTSENSRVIFGPNAIFRFEDWDSPDGLDEILTVRFSFNSNNGDNDPAQFTWGGEGSYPEAVYDKDDVKDITQLTKAEQAKVTIENDTTHYTIGDVARKIKWGGTVWRTPTKEELNYILFGRDDAEEKLAIVIGNDYNLIGLLILPDQYSINEKGVPNDEGAQTAPTTITLNENNSIYVLSDGDDDYSYYTQKGAVLIKSNYFYVPSEEDLYDEFYYWTSTGAQDTSAYALHVKYRESTDEKQNTATIEFEEVNRAKGQLPIFPVASYYKITAKPNFAQRGETVVTYAAEGSEVFLTPEPKGKHEFYLADAGEIEYNKDYNEDLDNNDVSKYFIVFATTKDTTITFYYRHKDNSNSLQFNTNPGRVSSSDAISIQASESFTFINMSNQIVKPGEEGFSYSITVDGGDEENNLPADTVTIKAKETSTSREQNFKFKHWEYNVECNISNGATGADGNEALIDTIIIINKQQITYPKDFNFSKEVNWNLPQDNDGNDYYNVSDNITFNLSLTAVYTPAYEIKGIEDLENITKELNNNYKEDDVNDAYVAISGEITSNNDVTKMSQNELDAIDGNTLSTFFTVAGAYQGTFDVNLAEIKDIILKTEGPLFENIAENGKVSGLILDNAALYLTAQNSKWEIDEEKKEVSINLIADVVSGKLEFGYNGKVLLSPELEKRFEGYTVYIYLIGKVEEGGEARGYYYNSEAANEANKTLSLHQVAPMQYSGGGSGIGDCKFAATFNEFDSKSGETALAQYQYSKDELNKSTRYFTLEEFEAGAASYWLNWSGKGYSGDYKPIWGVNELGLPVKVKSADEAIHAVKYECKEAAEKITAAPHFAKKGDKVVIKYSEKPNKITVDGKEIELGDYSASFTLEESKDIKVNIEYKKSDPVTPDPDPEPQPDPVTPDPEPQPQPEPEPQPQPQPQPDPEQTAIISTTANAVNVVGTKGAIKISGNFTTAEVFDIAGNVVAQSSERTIEIAKSGIYLVRIDGKVAKVVVK